MDIALRECLLRMSVWVRSKITSRGKTKGDYRLKLYNKIIYLNLRYEMSSGMSDLLNFLSTFSPLFEESHSRNKIRQ